MRRHIRSSIVIMTTAALTLAAALNPLEDVGAHSRKKPIPEKAHLTITVHASEQSVFESHIDMRSRAIAMALKQAKEEQTPDAAGTVDTLPDVEIEVLKNGKNTHYRLEESGNLWNESFRKRLVLPAKTSAMLLRLAQSLRKKHYGVMQPWEEVKLALPNKSSFDVTELETGLSFRVQRRAGSDHADVQPLTKADTATMKQIYGGRWSWKRKAVLIHSGEQWIAASMNGMPHGGDGIPENGFSGHFCIHFLGSSTHKSEFPDLAHQLMVHKAGGELKSLFDGASPASLAKLIVVAMNHHDEHLLKQLMKGLSESSQGFLLNEMEALEAIKESEGKKKQQPDADHYAGSLSAEVSIPVTIQTKLHGEKRGTYGFTFLRPSKDKPWRLANISY